MIESIVPRWEWRAFAGRVSVADDRLAARRPSASMRATSLPGLAVDSEASVKARDGLSTSSASSASATTGSSSGGRSSRRAFPRRAADVARLLDALGVPARSLDRDAYTLDELIAEVVAPSTDLLAVEVHKRRVHYTVGGCMAELHRAAHRPRRSTRTIAVESEDPDAS